MFASRELTVSRAATIVRQRSTCLPICLSTPPHAERRRRTAVDTALVGSGPVSATERPPDKAEVSGSSPLRPTGMIPHPGLDQCLTRWACSVPWSHLPPRMFLERPPLSTGQCGRSFRHAVRYAAGIGSVILGDEPAVHPAAVGDGGALEPCSSVAVISSMIAARSPLEGRPHPD